MKYMKKILGICGDLRFRLNKIVVGEKMLSEKNMSRLILIVTFCLMLLPTSTILGFEIPYVYFLTPISMFIAYGIIKKNLKYPSIVKILAIFASVIVAEIIIGTFISTYFRLGGIIIPKDIVTYATKFVFMISFIILSFNNFIDKEMFIKYFLITLIIAMLIGLLQWIPSVAREFMIKLYPFRDGTLQLEQLGRQLSKLRLHGFAQHATANGGFAAFTFIFGVSVLRFYKNYKLLSMLLLLLSLINIFASQSRAGMLALAFSFILFFIIEIKYTKKHLKSISIFLVIIGAISSISTYFYLKGNEFIVNVVYRWEVLIKTAGGSRASRQPQYFFSIMESRDYLFGLSKPIVNRSEISHGIEVEPLNILVTYGVVGFILQYTFLLIILIYLYKRISSEIEDKSTLVLIIASFVGLFSYIVFSMAFFFLREIRIGIFPWIIIGVAIGSYERTRKSIVHNL